MDLPLPHHLRRLRSVLASSCLVVGVGCGDGATDPGERNTGLQSIHVRPALVRLLAPGDSARFQAEGHQADGSVGPVEVTWSTDDAAVVEVGSDGWVVARAVGGTAVRAGSGDVEGRGFVVVNPDTTAPALIDVGVEPRTVTVGRTAQVVRLRAEFEDRGTGARGSLALFDGPLGVGITSIVALEIRADSALGSSSGDAAGPSSPGRRTVFEGFLEIPANTGAGEWFLTELKVDDRVGNQRQWGRRELEELGFVVRVLAVTSGG